MHSEASVLKAWVDQTGGPRPPPGSRTAAHYRSVWISDVHLGTASCRADALLDFLSGMDCEWLFLVGDIVDGWQLSRAWHWPQAHNDVVQKLLRKARKGTNIVYIPGNHDAFTRRYAGHQFGGIYVVHDWLHETADGRRLWVTHGDQFDGLLSAAPRCVRVGDALYAATLWLNRQANTIGGRLGLRYRSVPGFLKRRVAKAVDHVAEFERVLAREARRRGADGVVCGHIHQPALREIDGTVYANDGDWVESLTALVEHDDGRLELVRAGRRRPGATAAGDAASVSVVDAVAEDAGADERATTATVTESDMVLNSHG